MNAPAEGTGVWVEARPRAGASKHTVKRYVEAGGWAPYKSPARPCNACNSAVACGRLIFSAINSSGDEAAMACKAIETDNSIGAANGCVGVPAMFGLAAAPAEMRASPCGMARAGCAVSCPRFAACRAMDRQAFARRSCVTADQGVGA